MPRQRQFYDPQIDDGSPQETILRGFQVQIGGTYVLLDDVVTVLRMYADSIDSIAVHEAANWLISGQQLPEIESQDRTPDTTNIAHEVHGAEPDDVNLDVDRVEVFPNEEGKWFARSIDTGGNIMKTTNGSFDVNWVVQNAEDRWPGIPIRIVASESSDSMWEERGRKGPSPKRLWR